MAYLYPLFIYPLKTTLPETKIAPENRPSQKETSSEPTIDVQGRTVLFSGKIPLLYICARVDQLLVVLAMAIPPWIGNPFNGYINQDYMVDDYDAKFGLSMSSDFFITPWNCTGPSPTIWK